MTIRVDSKEAAVRHRRIVIMPHDGQEKCRKKKKKKQKKKQKNSKVHTLTSLLYTETCCRSGGGCCEIAILTCSCKHESRPKSISRSRSSHFSFASKQKTVNKVELKIRGCHRFKYAHGLCAFSCACGFGSWLDFALVWNSLRKQGAGGVVA